MPHEQCPFCGALPKTTLYRHYASNKPCGIQARRSVWKVEDTPPASPQRSDLAGDYSTRQPSPSGSLDLIVDDDFEVHVSQTEVGQQLEGTTSPTLQLGGAPRQTSSPSNRVEHADTRDVVSSLAQHALQDEDGELEDGLLDVRGRLRARCL
ncbi:hypothetical protein DFJ74DRAFT_687320, partial [Hyaloraphidium curvatum]